MVRTEMKLIDRIFSAVLDQEILGDSGFVMEAQMQFNKNRDVGFGNVLIMAGGAGSGKGFTLGHLIGLEGKIMDVDALKVLSLKTPAIMKKLESEFPGQSLSDPKFLKNPDNVSKLHLALEEIGIKDKHQEALFRSIAMADPSRKPNLIFDITLKDLAKLENLSFSLRQLGYNPKKIHLVWVLNDMKIALEQNKARSRTVPENILKATHIGASNSIYTLLRGTTGVEKSVNGDWYIAFNRAGIDTNIAKSAGGGRYVIDAGYVRLKESGKSFDLAKISKDLINKIREVVPNPEQWENLQT